MLCDDGYCHQLQSQTTSVGGVSIVFLCSLFINLAQCTSCWEPVRVAQADFTSWRLCTVECVPPYPLHVGG
jgi:hypothetical protein